MASQKVRQLRQQLGDLVQAVKRPLKLKPVRNVAVLVFAALFLAALGLLQAWSGNASLEVGEAHPLLRAGVVDVFGRIRSGIASVETDPHAFPSSPDVLVLLGAIAFVLPAMRRMGANYSVLSSLVLGIIIGPSGFCIFRDTGWSETLAQVGVLFFLCEMGLELNIMRLKKMWRDVFVIGAAQFFITASVIGCAAWKLIGLGKLQSFIIGLSLSLSSSAFVLQLLDEQKERGTGHGRTAFGILLLQDLIVPAILILFPMILDKSGPAAFAAMRQAVQRTMLLLAFAMVCGRLFLGNLFSFVASSRNSVALRCLSFFAVFGACYAAEAFGLPGMLGAFLAGVLLSETAYRQQVDSVISPIREDLFCVFFITMGFGLDLQLIFTRPLLVLTSVASLLLTKTLVTMAVCRLAGLSIGSSQQIGLLLSQAGEFSFVMLNATESHGAFNGMEANLLKTIIAMSLCSTPIFAGVGRSLTEFLEQSKALPPRPKLATTEPVDTGAEVVVCGYGRIGKMITQVLDERLVRWVAYDNNPFVVNEARRKDLPVNFGDVLQMAKASNSTMSDPLSRVKMLVITLSQPAAVSAALVIRQRKPDLKIMVSSRSVPDAKRLEQSGIVPLMPVLPEDSMLLNLPMGIAVLDSLGYSEEEIGPMVREKRLELIRNEEGQRQLLFPKGKADQLNTDFDAIAERFEEA